MYLGSEYKHRLVLRFRECVGVSVCVCVFDVHGEKYIILLLAMRFRFMYVQLETSMKDKIQV